jgi:hypothetical protein
MKKDNWQIGWVEGPLLLLTLMQSSRALIRPASYLTASNTPPNLIEASIKFVCFSISPSQRYTDSFLDLPLLWPSCVNFSPASLRGHLISRALRFVPGNKHHWSSPLS